jgi:hypothetical protein
MVEAAAASNSATPAINIIQYRIGTRIQPPKNACCTLLSLPISWQIVPQP